MSQTTDQLLERLKGHYLGPSEDLTAEILLTEVEAPGSNRRCDLLRMSGWSSRGAGIDVHELKVSRSDWLRELDDKAKAEAWWPHCNRFWIVAPEGVVEEAELPPGWGLMLPPQQDRHRRFRKVVAPADRDVEPTLELMQQLVNRAHRTAIRSAADRHHEHLQAQRRAHDEAMLEAAERGLDYRDRAALELGRKLRAELGDSFHLTEGVTRAIQLAIDTEAIESELRHRVNLLTGVRAGIERTLDGLEEYVHA